MEVKKSDFNGFLKKFPKFTYFAHVLFAPKLFIDKNKCGENFLIEQLRTITRFNINILI